MKKRILIVGTIWSDRHVDTLRRFLRTQHNPVVIHTGLETVIRVAVDLGLRHEAHEADWTRARSAGYIRNERLIDTGKVDLVFSMHTNDRCMEHLLQLARESRIPVVTA